MIYHANPHEPVDNKDFTNKQTVEFRCPDGSADVYLLLAGLTVAARHGLEMENALQFAEKTYVDVNIFDDEHKAKTAALGQLPVSCWDSAEKLLAQREIYQKYNVFPPSVIDGFAAKLRKYNDQNLRAELENNQEKLIEIVEKYFHCG
jgi:glutamine synthetase